MAVSLGPRHWGHDPIFQWKGSYDPRDRIPRSEEVNIDLFHLTHNTKPAGEYIRLHPVFSSGSACSRPCAAACSGSHLPVYSVSLALRVRVRRDAIKARVRRAKNISPEPTVRSTNGPFAFPAARRTRHPPKQTALITSHVSFEGESQSRQQSLPFSLAILVPPE